jgi:effector-binding domain-containing protein
VIDTPRISQMPDQLTAVIRMTGKQSEMQNETGNGYKELMAVLSATGIRPVGPWFTHHLRMDGEIYDYEVGVPVSSPVPPVGRVRTGRWPASTVARLVLTGSYEWLFGAWATLDDWIASQGHTPAADRWECYVRGPESSPDPSGWRTELNRPLLRIA